MAKIGKYNCLSNIKNLNGVLRSLDVGGHI
jgi:hypothetical protein